MRLRINLGTIIIKGRLLIKQIQTFRLMFTSTKTPVHYLLIQQEIHYIEEDIEIQGIAPLNEVLAAGLVLMSNWNPESNSFMDPFAVRGLS